MNKGYLVLFQKQIAVDKSYIPARTATVFKFDDNALETALKDIRFNFQPWAVSFKHLPPEHLLVRACEEQVRAGKAVVLPLTLRPDEKIGKLAQQISHGLVSPIKS